jgi:hypothetical protein
MVRRKPARPSGYQHRKKAAARKATHPAIQDMLGFANTGVWPATNVDLTIHQNRLVAAIHEDILAGLRRLEDWRALGERTGDVVTAVKFEVLSCDEARDTTAVMKVMTTAGIFYEVLWNLQEEDRWRNVYRCAKRDCRRWFYPAHPPRDSKRPFCGPKCWPSKEPLRSGAPRRRVQSLKKSAE